MKLASIATAIGLGACLFAGTAVTATAGEPPERIEVSGNVAFTSNYVWRGMTQTMRNPSLEGGLDIADESGLYIGAWASNVDFGDMAHIEIDLYGGYSNDVGTLMGGDEEILGFDIGFLSYRYPGEDDLDFEEIYAGLSKAFGPVEVGGMYFAGLDDATDYYEFSLGVSLEELSEVEILKGASVSATYGDYEDIGMNYSVGVSKPCFGLDWGITYWDFDEDSGSGLSSEDNWVFSVGKSL